MTLFHSIRANLFDKGIAHIRKGGIAVKSAFRFHFRYGMFHHLKLVFVQLKALYYIRISLDQLCCGESRRNAVIFRMVFDKMRNGVDAAMHRTAGAEIRYLRKYTVFCDIQRCVYKLVNAFVFGGAYRDHGNAELSGKSRYVN